MENVPRGKNLDHENKKIELIARRHPCSISSDPFFPFPFPSKEKIIFPVKDTLILLKLNDIKKNTSKLQSSSTTDKNITVDERG